ncbi:MAG: thrombospondin type 3 repeat-containing protein [Polyangiaceae bacterium]
MNQAKHWLTFVASLTLTSYGGLSVAHALEEFPGRIQSHLGLTYQVPCSVCHIKGNVAASTPITAFALSLRSRGLEGESSLDNALNRSEQDGVDSDGDGTTDVAELRAGTDPNSSANANIDGDQEPGYGCGGTAPHGRGAPAAMSIFGLGWLFVRRFRGRP